MDTLTITAKGQVTLRKEVLRHLGVEPGAKVEVDLLPDGRVEVRAAAKTGKISDFFGILHREGQPALSIEEINEAIAAGWAGKR
jgi:AbrB family looped-hinge helix DNA binding protein